MKEALPKVDALSISSVEKPCLDRVEERERLSSVSAWSAIVFRCFFRERVFLKFDFRILAKTGRVLLRADAVPSSAVIWRVAARSLIKVGGIT